MGGILCPFVNMRRNTWKRVIISISNLLIRTQGNDSWRLLIPLFQNAFSSVFLCLRLVEKVFQLSKDALTPSLMMTGLLIRLLNLVRLLFLVTVMCHWNRPIKMSDVCCDFISVINNVLPFSISRFFVFCVGQDDCMNYIYKIQIVTDEGR